MCGIFAYQGQSLAEISVKASFQSMSHRGPDDSQWLRLNNNKVVGFHRLAIVDPSHAGNQPFRDPVTQNTLVCNGEIYNHMDLREEFATSYPFQSLSDCEVILPLIAEYGLRKTCDMIDAEFAFVIHDASRDVFLAARDPIGIRPLFYGKTSRAGELLFASEAKALTSLCEDVEAFPPGHYFDGEDFHCYLDLSASQSRPLQDESEVLEGIEQRLVAGVKKRLHADVPIGFLLSGGLDSSLVCAIAARNLERPIRTFAVGCNIDAIDIKYAQQVADYIGARHTNVIFTIDEALAALKEVIYHLETWDITTVRASIGMYLVCKYIHESTDVKVLLTGEVSDELFGYKYTDYAPSPSAFQEEARKRIRELYMYDVLRADRCISAHCLEARVPFSDRDFVQYVMGIAPETKMNRSGVGKYLLRKAFENDAYLPHSILYREKAAFSDAVGHSVVDSIKSYAEEKYQATDLASAYCQYPFQTPFTKESLLYREIFESLYPGRAPLVKDYWMPNKEWQGCDVQDPSARALSNYGASGT